MSDKRFDAFVLFAEMRTGSNHLEESLNTLADITSYGELFNPVFMGMHNREELFGVSIAMREMNPLPLLDLIRTNTVGLPGFRFFHDHDPRIVDPVLDDPRVAKIILTRNPLDSYVSLAIARQTGQWRLTNPKMAKTGTARFDGAEFDAMLSAQSAFRDRIQGALQRSGQTAFWLSYDQIGDLDVLNGIAAFLGSVERLDAVPGKLKRQNPGDTMDKVENPDEMRSHLARLDPFGLFRSVTLEPSRGTEIATLMAAAESPLICLPVPGGPTDAVRDWMTRLDGAPPTEGMTERDLRPWLRKNKAFTSFAVLRHPLARAHDAWRATLGGKGQDANTLRRILTNQHGVTFPQSDAADAHADGLLAFLKFLKANLGGQSSLPVAPEWASQAEILAGLAKAILPQRILREFEVQTELDRLSEMSGKAPHAFLATPETPGPSLAEIYVEAHDDVIVDVYRRDFMQFGFKRWKNS
ncbi:MAG: nodulation protein NodH [Jannaschia sp.]